MLWLFRPMATLVFAPVLFVLALLYLQVQSSDAAGLWFAAGKQLLAIYVGFTLPALVLMLAILLPADLALRRTGLGLLTIVASPLIAALTAFILRHVTDEPHIHQWASAAFLFFIYGLVWGLTIRDPLTVLEPST